MITNFDIIQNNKNLSLDNETVERLLNYDLFQDLYDGNFKTAFAKTYSKICAKYPLDTTVSQTFVELNLFQAMTDFYKNLLTNQGLYINVNGSLQKIWNEIEKENNFLCVLKEVFVDVSRFGNGLFKTVFGKDGVEITSVSPSCWFPVFNKGNLNDLSGHIIINTLTDFVNGKTKTFKLIEKHRKGFTEYELWTYQNNSYNEKLDVEKELEIPQIDDFSDIWNDFLIFPVKNSSESNRYFGQSDYVRFKSVVEELILTVSQNSKILNRHANPKMTGSNENLEFNPVTGKSEFPNRDFIPVGRDGIKAEYITADLQENAVHQHINSLMNFFYVLSKTPPQAYGLDITNNMSGESLRKIFMNSLTKIDDIKQVSFNSAIEKLVKCALALNHTPTDEVKIDWGNPVPEDKSELIENTVKRISSGTLSRLSAIAELDNLSDFDANEEFEKIQKEKDLEKE
ncbi:MAG: phage portal protein [Candidatus Gastranaerophilales bacterium]|nr:phage portal protein [Candidatus Gastranaerophilales bacterium]